MNFGKIFRQIVSTLFITAILLANSVSHADIKIYEGLGVYYLNDGEPIDSANKKAELNAWRIIVEQVKVDISSGSCLHNLKLPEDEIITIAAGILRVIETKHAIEVEEDALIVKAFVTATIDTDELETLLDNAIKNR